MCEIWVMRASPAVARGVAPVGGLPREMMKPGPVFATNANVPADGGGAHHVAEKAGGQSLTMGSTGSRNLWPRKRSRACESELVGGMWGRRFEEEL